MTHDNDNDQREKANDNHLPFFPKHIDQKKMQTILIQKDLSPCSYYHEEIPQEVQAWRDLWNHIIELKEHL